jgi:beta-lactam-binding protein with PASTA domain
LYLPEETFHLPNPQTIAGQRVTVPSVYGLRILVAARELRKAGFTPVVGPTVDSGNTAGTVAYLSPGSGGQAATGSTVTIYVSDGTPYVPPKPRAPSPSKKPGPGKPTPGKPSPGKPSPGNPGPTKPGPTKPGPTKPGPTKPGPTKGPGPGR